MLVRFFAALVAALFPLVVHGQISLAGVITARAPVDGLQEAPGDASPAKGSALLSFNSDSGNDSSDLLVVGLTLTHISLPDGDGLAFSATGPVHLHNAPVGANAPIMGPFADQFLYSETSDGFALRASGSLAAVLTGVSTDAFLNELTLGNIYVSVHSFPEFPAGELRRQLFVIPEPASLILLAFGLGILCLAGLLRRPSNRVFRGHMPGRRLFYRRSPRL